MSKIVSVQVTLPFSPKLMEIALTYKVKKESLVSFLKEKIVGWL